MEAEHQKILGVRITNLKQSDILKYILQSLSKTVEKYYIVTPNPEILVYSYNHPGFRAILNHSRLALCDGVGVIWAGKILGKTFKERTTGTDLLDNLCKHVEKQPITVGFLGGRLGVAVQVSECLKKKYPGLKVVFAAPEWPDKLNMIAKEDRLKMEDGRLINPPPSIIKNLSSTFYPPSSNIDLLFVAFGFPKQEEWISQNLDKIPVRIAIGVGGAFDYLSGQVSRAPLWMQKIGLEWLYRLIRQPWRLKRQLALIKFIYLVFKERLEVVR